MKRNSDLKSSILIEAETSLYHISYTFYTESCRSYLSLFAHFTLNVRIGNGIMKPIFEAISIMPEKYGKGVKNKLLGNCTQKRPFYFLYYEVVWTELDL